MHPNPFWKYSHFSMLKISFLSFLYMHTLDPTFVSFKKQITPYIPCFHILSHYASPFLLLTLDRTPLASHF